MFALKISSSRWGAHLGYSLSRNGRRNRLLLVVAVMLFVIFYFSAVVKNQLTPIARTLARAQAKSAANVLVNEAVIQYFSGVSDDVKFYTAEKNAQGDIASITLNTANVNTAKAEIIGNIQKRLAAADFGEVGIPLGSISGSEFFAGMGPKLPLKIIAAGMADVDFTNEFVSAGINQTKHIVYIEASLAVSAILPGARENVVVTSKIPIEETVIVGTVPGVYANFNFSNN